MSKSAKKVTPLAAWITLFVLFLAYISSFVDRMILNLLVAPIERDLNLSDTEFSLLQGPAFALFYTIMGIPIARLLDKHNRLKIIAVGIAIWSLMTAACGMAGRFSTLFLARVGVGIGEATLTPGAYSVIADSFSDRRLGLAMGIYNLGAAVGAGLAMMLGGMLIGHFNDMGGAVLPVVGFLQPWQLTFVAVGVPGLLVAALIVLLREPPRIEASSGQSDSPTFRDVLAFWWRHRQTLALHHGAVTFANFALVGCMAWIAAFLIRAHGMTIKDIGMAVGAAILVTCVIGHVGAGLIADHICKRNPETGRIQVAAGSLFLAVPFALLFPYVDNTAVAIIFFGIALGAMGAPVGGAAAALAQMTPNRMRSTMSAIYLLVVNMIGMSLGPMFVAILSDTVFTESDGIRYSLMVAIPSSALIGGILFALCAPHYRKSLLAVKAGGNPGDNANSGN